MPTVLWDKSASERDAICGVPVVLPEYSSLTSDDFVLIFPSETKAKEELLRAVENGNKEKTPVILDMEDIFLFCRYPQFYSTCRFIGS